MLQRPANCFSSDYFLFVRKKDFRDLEIEACEFLMYKIVVQILSNVCTKHGSYLSLIST